MVRMSRTRGTRFSVTLSSVRSAAARAGRAEFFEPLVGMVPCSGAPPSMTNLSINPIFVDESFYRGANVVSRRFESVAGLFGRRAGGYADDAYGAIAQFGVLRLHVHHQVAAHVAHADKCASGEHVEYKLGGRAGFEARGSGDYFGTGG